MKSWKKIVLGILGLLAVFILLAVLNRHRIKVRGDGMSVYLDFSSSQTASLVEADRAKQPKREATPPANIEELSKLPAWPGYRGALRDGKSTETGLLKEWPPTGPRELYRKPIGLGWGAFAIGLGRSFTLEQRGADEVVACYDFENGDELWTHRYPARFTEQMGGEGPRSTPTLDSDRLYTLGAEGELCCLNALTGAKIWSANILKETKSENLHWAMSGSPLILDDRVYVTASGATKGSDSLLVYDKLTGELKLKTLNVKQSYASLEVVTLNGKKQLLDFAGDFLFGLEIADGKPLWSFPWEMSNDINASQPLVIGENRVFISSGYGKGCALIEIRPRESGGFEAAKLWDNPHMKNKFAPAILHEGHVYGLDEEFLACMDAQTGKRKWKGGRYGHGQLMFADGRLIVVAEDGQLALVEASPEAYKEISKFQALDGKTWNLPALAGGRLLIRNDREMVAYDLKG